VVEPFRHPKDPVVIDSVTNPRQAVQVADHHPGQKARDPRVDYCFLLTCLSRKHRNFSS